MDRVFTIQPGNHDADGLHTKILIGVSRISFVAIFYPDCLYVPQENPGQINKLFGISFGRHHNASARIGWRSDGKQIELLSYVYTDQNIRMWRSFGMVDVGVRSQFEIERTGHNLRVSCERFADHHYHIVNPQFWGYYLYPYFGGKIPAPHRMRIQVRVLGRNGREKRKGELLGGNLQSARDFGQLEGG